MSIQFPKSAKDLITSPIPSNLIFKKPGRAGADYISGSTVIDYLNNAFKHLWSYEVIEQWVQPGVDKVYRDKTTQVETVTPQGPVAHVKGRLTIYVPDSNGNMFSIIKEQYGSKAVIGGQMDQEHIFKAAGTDALKKCASLVGIGLELYRKPEEQEYYDYLNYENPWTDEALAKHNDSLSAIREFRDKYNISNEDPVMRGYLKAFSGGEFDDMSFILPENVKQFADYLLSLEDK